MLSKVDDSFLELKKNISRERKIAKEMIVFSEEMEKAENSGEKKEITRGLKTLKSEIEKTSDGILSLLNQISISNPFENYSIKVPEIILETEQPSMGTPPRLAYASQQEPQGKMNFSEKITKRINEIKYKSNLPSLDRETLKRIKKKEEEEKTSRGKIKKPSIFIRKANQFFSDYSAELIKRWEFKKMQSNLMKSNLNFLLKSYISIIILSTLASFALSLIIFVFLLFFDVNSAFPIITLAGGNFAMRILKTFWIIFFIPAAAFLFMFFYPSLEKDSVERRINLELPFAAINMAAVSGSMIDPTKIFQIMVSTKEYPSLEKEFIKLLNSVNVLGLDFVTALKNSAFNTASKKLGELYSGLATTINSGGDLPKFFEERAKSMLFEYNLEKEKNTKAAETFMDIYISVVIAAPMILMLLLMLMRISGLGIPLSTGAITLMMILGVVGINIIFLTFLHIKQPNV